MGSSAVARHRIDQHLEATADEVGDILKRCGPALRIFFDGPREPTDIHLNNRAKRFLTCRGIPEQQRRDEGAQRPVINPRQAVRRGRRCLAQVRRQLALALTRLVDHVG